MAEFSATARNDWMGIPADALKKLKELGGSLAQVNTPFTAPVGELLQLLIGGTPEVLDKLSYGERITSGKGETLHMDPGVLDAMGLVPGALPAKGAAAIKALAVGLADKLPAVAAIGALRAGGNPALFATHGSTMNKLLRAGDELTSPSLGVTKGVQNHFGEDSGIVLLAKEGAFDPRYSTSTLLNRDGYTPRIRGYRMGKAPTYNSAGDMRKEETAWARLDDRFKGPIEERIKFGEGHNYPGSLSIGHQAGIEESPVFRSFKEYERDPRGAQTLSDISPVEASEYWITRLQDWYRKTMDDNAPRMWSDAKIPLVEAAKRGDEEARQILFQAKRLPSEYGELKVHGQVPLNSDYWAGAFLNPAGTSTDTVRNMEYQLKHANIPVTNIPQLQSAEQQMYGHIPYDKLRQVAEEMQKNSGPYAGRVAVEDWKPLTGGSTLAQINPKFHAKQGKDPAADLSGMNEVWDESLGGPGVEPKDWGIDPEMQKFLDEAQAKLPGGMPDLWLKHGKGAPADIAWQKIKFAKDLDQTNKELKLLLDKPLSLETPLTKHIVAAHMAGTPMNITGMIVEGTISADEAVDILMHVKKTYGKDYNFSALLPGQQVEMLIDFSNGKLK